MEVKAGNSEQIVGLLSGGNQQKICLGKWLAAGCEILIIDEPTVGVDIGAKDHIHRMIWNLAEKEGKSIIVISSDMPEIIRLAHRIYVFRDQTIIHEIPDIQGHDHTYEKISHEIGRYLN